MRIIKAGFKVVTPLFLGESPEDKDKIRCAEEIRGASVKGALRAYFRALNWSRIRQNHTSDEAALKQLYTEESYIFGSAVRDKKGGQSQFLLRIKSDKVKPEKELPENNAELQYLLGLGLYHFNKGMLRDHIPAGTEFKLEFLLKRGLDKAHIQQIKDTVLAFGLLGGLGSRARKGFGSVAITSLEVMGEEQSLPQNVAEYQSALKKLIGTKLIDQAPPFSAFSALTRMQVSARSKNALDLLKKHGKEMGAYRGYGRNGQVFGATAEKNFKADHDWAYDLSERQADKEYLPKRAVFGLPHSYYLSGALLNVAVEAETGRRASPLLAHIHQFPDGNCALVHTLMRSVFLPKKVAIDIKTKPKTQNYSIKNTEEKIDWEVLERYLARFEPKQEDRIYG